ncbi:hypothetical protein [Herbidospora cretacea]|uniref:hypothetical protein n=1 Tax=Herbidospora cretacea TaxID=28444 RepID=UPI001471B807|nr:hypothetical protein [Herbidospora cretacea]
MVSWRQGWRSDRGLMERLCRHGVGHPDPDDIDRKRRARGDDFAWAEAVHGCDGCCRLVRGEVIKDQTSTTEHKMPASVYRVYPEAANGRNLYGDIGAARSVVAERKRHSGWKPVLRVYRAKTVWEDVTHEFVKQ